MMYNRSESGHRRQHGDRDARPWDVYDDRWEERTEPQRDVRHDSYDKYDKYGGEGHSRTQGVSRGREYSESPKRPYSQDLKRGHVRKSPVRRGVSSTDWIVPEKKRRMFPEEEDDTYKYKREPEDEPYKQSPDKFPHRTKDYKHSPPLEEEFRFRKTPQDLRYGLRQEEFPPKQRPDDSTYRRASGYYADRDGGERNQEHPRERAQSQDRSMKRYGLPPERSDSFSTDYEDHRQNRTRVPLNSSSGQSFEHHEIKKIVKSRHPEPKNSAKGFQRFLDVLNKGVNFNVLTKIVSQTHTDADDRPRSPASFQSADDRPWSPSSSTWRQQGGHQNTEYWNETDEGVRRASPRPHHSSFSPNRCDASDEKSPKTKNEGRSYFSPNSRSLSPLMLGTTALNPEDEHKRRQMQNVLQAIGINLGFDELGQMSHRIQERLYGKKDGEKGRDRKESTETKRSQAFSPRRQSPSFGPRRRSPSFSPRRRSPSFSPRRRSPSFSPRRRSPSFSPRRRSRSFSPRRRSRSFSPRRRNRSSSSKSSFIAGSQRYYRRSNSRSVPRAETEPDRDVEYSHQSSSGQDNDKSDKYSKDNAGATNIQPYQTFNPIPPPPVLEPPPMPPVSYAPLPFPPLSPNMPPIGPQFFLPQLPPFLRYPPIPPVNMFPGVLAQTQHFAHPHMNNHPPPFFHLPDLHPPPPLSTPPKQKPLARPRCLQVIETKQPG